MKYKKSMIILIILTVFLFGIACACASDMNDTAVACDDSMPIESIQDNNLNTDENNEILTDNPKTFTQLDRDINESQDTFEVKYDYTFNNESDNGPVVIDKNDFTINGNNHILDGNGQSGIFNITGKNVTINDLIFKNGKTTRAGIVDSTGEITLNNVTFIMNNVTYINDHITYLGGAIANHGGKITCINSRFIDNHAESGSAILIEGGELYVKNTYFTSTIPNKYGQIWARSSYVEIDNAEFINLSSIYSPAISLEYCNMRVTNSRFINLTADMSAGAIGIKRYGNLYIKGCEFKNTRSFKNAGAINVDYINFGNDSMDVTILDTTFDNSYSMIGGAYIQLGGRLVMNNTNFTNNRATYYGGAVYLSFTKSQISNCTFDSNAVELVENYTTSGGAIYSDYNNLTIDNSRFTNNSAPEGNAVYAYDTSYNITCCTFKNNKNAIYSYFDKNPCRLDNNIYSNDTVVINETLSYATFVDSPALKYEPVTNTINVTGLPSRFDLRDWGWVTPVKNQGYMGACWTFGTMGALESALLKTYGIEFDLSEGNLHHNMMRYFKYGYIPCDEGGESQLADSYLLGWYGPELEIEDIYDEVGKLSPFKTSGYDTLHVQDVIIIANDEIGVGSKIKSAIMKYGALSMPYFADVFGAGYYDYKTSSQYTNESLVPNHEVCVIGWDDSYSKDNFLITPPGDGAWIIKNSWGTLFGDNGILYISYYDKTMAPGFSLGANLFGIILENNISYNKNYQHDFTWMGYFKNITDLTGSNGSITYANQFESAGDDLIAAVGTYFNASDVNYTVKIYVNDELKLTQEGLSPYMGYHTIKLNQYIPIREGDVFKAVVTSNTMPMIYCNESRVHFSRNMSFYLYEGEWRDLLRCNDSIIACLKVYTVADDCIIVDNEDIAVDYRSDSYYTIKVTTSDGHAVSAGVAVNFTINEKTTTVLTDEDGIAKIKITETPGTYTMTTTLNGKDYTNTVTVIQVPTPAMTFKELEETIKNSTKDYLDLYDDYEFNNETDNKIGILIDRDNFVINGNGHTIDGKNLSRIFNITANNVTLSNLILTGGNAEKGGAIYTTGSLTLNNVTFIDNYASKQGAAVGLYENVTIKCDNSRFIDNYAVEKGSAIYLDKGELDLSNTNMTSKWVSKSAQITVYKNAIIHIQNAIFADTTSTYSPALYIQRSKVSIINSKFNNLKADITAGAISLKECGEVYIENCEFTNITSSKNGGAINADIWGDAEVNGNVTIIDTIFKDTSSGFGGAYLQLGGNLFINNTLFTNNHATYNGGSLYLSYVTSNITNCNFTSNGVDVIEGYPTYGGAIFNDMGTLNVDKSNFINNTASAGNAICAYDSSYNIKNSLFENNTNPIYTFFDEVGVLDNNVYINDDNVSTNNELHSTIVIGQGLQLTLLNNTINVTNLPAKFDLRDWEWVSPVRDQGWMGACWTFGMTGALESVILKAAGITSDFSENNMKDSMYRYSIYGDTYLVEGGNSVYAISYLVSWLGALIYDADVYDEMGKISPIITTLNDVHVQDAIFVPNNEIPNGTKLKEAIIKYGSLAVSYYGQSTYDESNPYYNETTYAQYVDKPLGANHAVSIVGWDDNFPKENFLITPPGDGAWIVKNSWGPGWGDNGFLYVSYYDQTLLKYDPAQPSSCAATVIFENIVPYNKNYQYAIIGGGNFMSGEKNVSYMNVFEALDDDLIAAVGTYFNQGGVNYTVEIYVNDELKLTQNGVSPFFGYHTIKLDDYIPIKKGDVFKAIITSNAMPYITQPELRVHYTENISFFSMDGAPWADSYKDGGAIVCLKVYTVADDSKIINNENITVDYGSGSYFTVQVVTANGHSVGEGAAVNITINGKTTTVFTDADGIAKVEITDVPGTYNVTTTYNGETYKNSVAVKLNPSTCKITQNTDITVDYDGGKYFTVKIVSQNGKVAASGVSVKFTINGKTTTVKTDKNGIAKIKITDIPKKYTMTTTYNGKSVKNTVTVKQVLKAKKVTVKKTAKKLTLKATLKINGKLQKGKVITFKFNGKTYKAKTNKKGIAKVTIKKKVIKKLKKGKKYTVKVTYKKDTIKTTVKVK